MEKRDGGAIRTESSIYSKTFLWMFLGLFATGLISWYTYSTGLAASIMSGAGFAVVMIVELVVVLLFSFLFRKLPPTVVAILFFVYAIFNGISLSTIFYTFQLKSIIIVFFASAALFGLFAFIGAITKKDLSKLGTILFGVLIVGIIVSLINLFVGNSMIDLIVSWIVLFVFFGVTAYDMQKIRVFSESGVIPADKVHIYGAMQLYLDFINIFVRILNIFGKRE
ncbi:MAG: Bax inhibitor-1/YccA family protein [Clostridia bacterium]